MFRDCVPISISASHRELSGMLTSGGATKSKIRLDANSHRERSKLYATTEDLMRWQRKETELILCGLSKQWRSNTAR